MNRRVIVLLLIAGLVLLIVVLVQMFLPDLASGLFARVLELAREY